MRKLLLNILRVAVSLGLMVWLLAHTELSSLQDVVRRANPSLLLLGLAMYQAGLILRAVRWRFLLKDVGLEMPVPRLIGLNYVGAFFSNFLPVGFGGDIVRAAELQDGESGAVSGGIVLLEKALGLSALVSIGLVALLFGWRILEPGVRLSLLGISIGVLLGIALLFEGRIIRAVMSRLLPERFSLMGDNWLSKFYNALSGSSRRAVVITWGISLVNNILAVLIHYTLARAVGVAIKVQVFAMFAPIVMMAALLPTVQGLGVREQGYRLLLGTVGVSADVAIATGLAVFGVRFATGMIGALYYVARSLRGLLIVEPAEDPG